MKLGNTIRLNAVLGKTAPNFDVTHVLYDDDKRPCCFVGNQDTVRPSRCNIEGLRKDIERFPGWRVTPHSSRFQKPPGYIFFCVIHRDDVPMNDVWSIKVSR